MKILRFPQLKDHSVSYCRMHVDPLEAKGEFPLRVHLGPNSVGWVEDEVDAYIAAKIAARDSAPVREAPPVGAKATAPSKVADPIRRRGPARPRKAAAASGEATEPISAVARGHDEP